MTPVRIIKMTIEEQWEIRTGSKHYAISMITVPFGKTLPLFGMDFLDNTLKTGL